MSDFESRVMAELQGIRVMLEGMVKGPPRRRVDIDEERDRALGSFLAAWYAASVGWLTTSEVLALGLPGAPKGPPRSAGRILAGWSSIKVRALGSADVYRLRSKLWHNQHVWMVEKVSA